MKHIVMTACLVQLSVGPVWAQAESDWSRVARLRPGTDIQLVTADGTEGRRHVIHADAGSLTVLDTSDPSVPEAVAQQLRRMAVDRPEALLALRRNSEVIVGDLRLGPGGVWLKDRRISPALVLLTIPRDDVVRVSRRERRGSAIGAIVGGAAGVLGGFYTAGLLAFKPCGGSCGDEKLLIGLSLVGLPIGGAILGYHAKIETTDAVGYRRPAPATRPLPPWHK